PPPAAHSSLSLHAALPIWAFRPPLEKPPGHTGESHLARRRSRRERLVDGEHRDEKTKKAVQGERAEDFRHVVPEWLMKLPLSYRSEQHTSELQSSQNIVCR